MAALGSGLDGTTHYAIYTTDSHGLTHQRVQIISRNNLVNIWSVLVLRRSRLLAGRSSRQCHRRDHGLEAHPSRDGPGFAGAHSDFWKERPAMCGGTEDWRERRIASTQDPLPCKPLVALLSNERRSLHIVCR